MTHQHGMRLICIPLRSISILFEILKRLLITHPRGLKRFGSTSSGDLLWELQKKTVAGCQSGLGTVQNGFLIT